MGDDKDRHSDSMPYSDKKSDKNDKKDGQWLVYSDNGSKLFQMEYRDGEKTGTWYQWDEKGEVMKTTTYNGL